MKTDLKNPEVGEVDNDVTGKTIFDDNDKEEGGRKTNEAGRQRVVFFIYNRSVISDNVDISPTVRNFCLTTDCLRKTMMEYFGSTGDSGDSWCCSNCDRNV